MAACLAGQLAQVQTLVRPQQQHGQNALAGLGEQNIHQVIVAHMATSVA
jgi:hypothetical protein